MWNSLPDAAVNSATINQFKSRLDRHWSKQEMITTRQNQQEFEVEVTHNTD